MTKKYYVVFHEIHTNGEHIMGLSRELDSREACAGWILGCISDDEDCARQNETWIKVDFGTNVEAETETEDCHTFYEICEKEVA